MVFRCQCFTFGPPAIGVGITPPPNVPELLPRPPAGTAEPRPPSSDVDKKEPTRGDKGEVLLVFPIERSGQEAVTMGGGCTFARAVRKKYITIETLDK